MLAVLGLAVFSTALATSCLQDQRQCRSKQRHARDAVDTDHATALGVLVLDETLTIHQIVGALIIASGLVVIDGRLLARFRREAKPA